jgi:hypothetical protein
MVHIPFLLVALSVAGCTTAYSYAYNKEAKISLFEPAKFSETPFSTNDLDCRAGQPSTDITLSVDRCLWGDYFLVNNFQITSYPTCGNGAKAVTYFYETTSCTGKPTFRSDEADVELEGTCLFGSSPEKWSMIFRCENLDSQSVSKGNFGQAIPPNYLSNKKPAVKPNPVGVITPHFAYDCTVNRPKQPTFLPADTCLTLEVGHSLYITEPVICSDGRTALVQTYNEPNCESPSSWLGTDVSSGAYYDSINKKCHTTDARSVAFKCSEKEIEQFEDLPEHKFKDVKSLKVLPPSTFSEKPFGKPSSAPALPKPNNAIVNPQAPLGKNVPLRPTSSTKATSNVKPAVSLNPFSVNPQSATIQPYSLKNCKVGQQRDTASVKKADTCIWTFMWESMQIKSPAICLNGTQALFATYSRPGCKPEEMTSFGEIPEDYSSGCADISKVDSIAFWCEGLPASEIGNKGSIGGLVKILLLILLVFVLMGVLSIVGCCLRGAAMMRQANELWGRIMEAFGKREGAIQL